MTNGLCHPANIILISILILLSSGCSLWQNRVAFNDVVIETAADANDNTPVAVDIVAIADNALLPTVQSLSATQWFNAKSQLLRDSPDGLHVWSLELVPDSRFVTKSSLCTALRQRQFCCFARYSSAGEHRLTLEKADSLHLLLMTDEAVLAP